MSRTFKHLRKGDRGLKQMKIAGTKKRDLPANYSNNDAAWDAYYRFASKILVTETNFSKFREKFKAKFPRVSEGIIRDFFNNELEWEANLKNKWARSPFINKRKKFAQRKKPF